MLAYYGSRISEHMTKTPEGFLICHDVPIARTGRQDYLPAEIGQEGTELVPVYRTEEEVFSPGAMASFEGKPVTADHPPTAVLPENFGMYLKGHAQNVRRGKGADADLLVADLFIDDRDLIRQIDDGLREVSCGYECDYVPDEQGRLIQRRIRGNHVAIVEAGRAGSRVSIKDSASAEPIQKEKGGNKMSHKNQQPSMLARFFSGWAKDRDPDEVAAAVDEMVTATPEEEKPLPQDNTPAPAPAPAPAPVQQPEQDEAPADPELKMLIKQLIAKLSEEEPTQEDDDPLEKLTAELTEGKKPEVPADDGEESVTVPAAEINGADDDPGAKEPEKQPLSQADTAGTLAAIQAMKPYLAKLPANERRAASDAAVAAVRKAMGKPGKPTGDNYAAIARFQAQNARGKQKPATDESELGKGIMARHNPHYKAQR